MVWRGRSGKYEVFSVSVRVIWKGRKDYIMCRFSSA